MEDFSPENIAKIPCLKSSLMQGIGSGTVLAAGRYVIGPSGTVMSFPPSFECTVSEASGRLGTTNEAELDLSSSFGLLCWVCCSWSSEDPSMLQVVCGRFYLHWRSCQVSAAFLR
jgi:hypothetical protein